MRLGGIMLKQLSVDCRIRHCWNCCAVGGNTFVTCRAAQHYWLQQLRLMNRPNANDAKFLDNSCASLVGSCYFIL